MGAAVLELSANMAEKPGVSKSSGANSDAQKPEIDADLAKVVTAWPKLGSDARLSILAIVEGEV